MKKSVVAIYIILALMPNGIMFGEDIPTVASLKPISYSMDQAVQVALANSFQVKIAKLDLLISETDEKYSEAVFDTLLIGKVNYIEDKREQVSVFAPNDNQSNEYSISLSKKLPTGTILGGEWSDIRSWNNSQYSTPNPAHDAELTLNIEQPIGKNFFGYIDRNTVTITRLAIENATLDTKDRIEAIIARVQKSYMEFIYRKMALEIYEGIYEKAKSMNDVNETNFEVGLIEKAELLASNANLLTIETDVNLARNNMNRALENLKLLMNVEKNVIVEPIEVLDESEFDKNIEWCLQEAFECRRDYEKNKRNIEIKDITLKMKANNKWPEIDLKASLSLNGVDNKIEKAAGETTIDKNRYYYAGVEFSFPLENNAARSEHEKASFDKEKAIVELKETERTIITEVGNAYEDYRTYDNNLLNLVEVSVLHSKKLDEEMKRFKYGRSSTKNVIDYQNDLLKAELKEITVLLELENSKIELKRKMNVILKEYV